MENIIYSLPRPHGPKGYFPKIPELEYSWLDIYLTNVSRHITGFSALDSARPALQPGAPCQSAQVGSQFHLCLNIETKFFFIRAPWQPSPDESSKCGARGERLAGKPEEEGDVGVQRARRVSPLLGLHTGGLCSLCTSSLLQLAGLISPAWNLKTNPGERIFAKPHHFGRRLSSKSS